MMDNFLTSLENYFFADAAEQERDFINDVFIVLKDFEKIITPRPRTISLIVGNKGSGKSALMEYLRIKFTEQKIPVVRLVPSDLKNLSFPENCSPAEVLSSVYESVLMAVSVKIGSGIKGIVLNQDQSRLLREAVQAGAMDETLTRQIVNVILPIGKAISNVEFEKMLPKYEITQMNRENIIKRYMHRNPEKSFYILLDDIDQIANAKRTDYYDIIWAEILALLKIASEIKTVRPIISVRQEIWRHLSVDDGNRDQLDHIRGMVYALTPSRDDLRNIVERRLSVCIKQNNLSCTTVYSPFFVDDRCRVPNSSEHRSWGDYLVSSSRENPRDIIYLVRSLIQSALENDHTKINDDDVQNIAYAYSKSRFDDLVSQNKDVFTNLDSFIRQFSYVDFEQNADDLKKHIINFLGVGQTIVNGRIIHAENEDEIFQLWNALYSMGFISPRDVDNTQPNKYTFLSYDKTLVSCSRWNEMQRYSWDVHPCYRPFFIALHEQEQRRLLPSNEKRRHKGRSTRKERRRK